MVNIEGLDKHQLLHMLISGTEIVSMYWGLHQDGGNTPKEELKYVDYFNGVKIGIDFSRNEVSSYIYNRCAGDNKLEKIVAAMRRDEEEKKKTKKE